MSLVARIKGLFSRKELHREIEEELQSHLEMRAEESMAAGMSPQAARRDAALRFGNRQLIKERVVAADAALTLESIWADVRQAFRRLWKSPAFTSTAVLTFALGLGANTAIFSVVDAVLLRPLPYKNPERLVVVWQASAAHRSTGAFFNAYRELEEWQQSSRSFERLAPLSWATAGKTLLWHNKPVDLLPIPAGADFFSMLGVTAQMGRTFVSSDLNNACTLVLSHHFWKEKLGAPAGIIGQSLTLDQTSCQVAGVMPKTFSFYPVQTDAWTLITPTSEFARKPWETMTGVFGLLKPGVTRASAEAELSAIQSRIADGAPPAMSSMRTMSPDVLDLQSNFTWLAGRNLKTALWVLLAAVAAILLMTCINLATLLLGRAAERSREMAMRAALGSGRARLFSQLFAESLLIATTGTCSGVLLAELLLGCFRATNPVELPPGNPITLDWRVLCFSACIGAMCAILFGVYPAWRGSQVDLNTVLKSGERGQGRGVSGISGISMERISRGLIVLQVALSLILLAGASLLGESLRQLSSTKLGYRTDHLLTAKINLPQKLYADQGARLRFATNFEAKLAMLPGVQASTLGSNVVPRGIELLAVRDRPELDKTAEGVARQDVAANFLSVMRVPLLRGRTFDDRDGTATQQVALISEALRRKYFPDRDAVGRTIKMSRADDSTVPWLTIVGVVGDVKTDDVFQELGYQEQPAVYRPLTQEAPQTLSVVVATRGESTGLTGELQAQLSDIDHGLLLAGIETVDQMQSAVLSQPRFRALLFGSFAFLALTLALVGLYGVLMQMVLQRTREIGIRMAVGADRNQILRSILRRAFFMVGTGLLLGLAGAIGAGRLMRSLLYGVHAGNLLLLGSSCAIMLLTGMAAALPPAYRAASVDPVRALRSE